jgi:hypothetical protein
MPKKTEIVDIFKHPPKREMKVSAIIAISHCLAGHTFLNPVS